VRGLSLHADGANLPHLHENTVWLLAGRVPLSADALSKHVRDTTIAIVNLKARGYHLARISAKVLRFPQPHRSAS
jgi:hypothetical protein